MSDRPWKTASSKVHDEVQLATWRAALEAARGNITRAAVAVGIARSHGMRLVDKYDLTDFAARLRKAAGSPATGRPRKITKVRPLR